MAKIFVRIQPLPLGSLNPSSVRASQPHFFLSTCTVSNECTNILPDNQPPGRRLLTTEYRLPICSVSAAEQAAEGILGLVHQAAAVVAAVVTGVASVVVTAEELVDLAGDQEYGY